MPALNSQDPDHPTPQDGPLSGVRVLDLSSVLMGPYATQIFADLGADVIWIEEQSGDRNRAMGPGPTAELSGVSMNLLRNKRSVCLDLKHPEGRDACLRIAGTCDVFLTNLRPGPRQRLLLDYEQVRSVRPDIIYCQAAGYASDSVHAEEPAYDDIIQATSGICDDYLLRSGIPEFSPYVVADKVAGLTIAWAVLAALFHRGRTGEGQLVEVPMTDAITAFNLVEHGNAAIAEPSQGPAGYGRVVTPTRRPKQTSDGWIAVVPYSRESYEAIFREGGRNDLIGDGRLSSRRALNANANTLYTDVEDIIRTRTTAEWLEFCRSASIPASPIRTLQEVVGELPLVDHPTAGSYRMIPSPARFSRTPTRIRRHADGVGEHTDDVLAEVGFSGAEIEALHQRGAAPRPSNPLNPTRTAPHPEEHT